MSLKAKVSNFKFVEPAERQIYPERLGKVTWSAPARLRGDQVNILSSSVFLPRMKAEANGVEDHIGRASSGVIHRMLWVGSSTITKCFRLGHFQCFPQVDGGRE
jgi:hypothetical protein